MPAREIGQRRRDELRNASLWTGGASPETAVPRMLRGFQVPPLPIRVAQRIAMKVGWLDWDRSWFEPLLRAHQAMLGTTAAGPPRLLVRADEFPYYSALDHPEHGNEASRRFNDVIAANGVHHLMSITTQLTHAVLDPAAQGGRPLGKQELAVIEEMRGSGLTTFAQHGTTHRTRFADSRHQSEYLGLDDAALAIVLDSGRSVLRDLGIDARVLVAPFNRFAASQWRVLSERFDVICGGPETVAQIGLHGGPLWHGDAVYLPCYTPLYGRARDVLPAVQRIIDRAPGTWIPVALHTMWELDDNFASLARLAELIAPYAVPWGDFLTELDRSATATTA